MKMQVDGQRIRALRLAQSWSQEMLAERAGVSLRTIQRMEIDGIASLKSRRAVAETFELPPKDLSPEATSVIADVEPGQGDSDRPVMPAVPQQPSEAVLRAQATGVWAVTMIALVGGGYLLLHRNSESPVDEPIVATEPSFVTVAYGDIAQVVSAPGKLQTREVVTVVARASGKLTEMLVKIGDFVAEGQILARIDSQQQQLRVESHSLDLEMQLNQLPERELELTAAGRAVDRLRTQNQDVASTRREFERAQRELLSAEINLSNLQILISQREMELQREQMLLNQTEIRAPISGTVIAVDQKEGDILSASDTYPTVVQIADLTAITVEARIHEADISALREGTESWFTMLGSGNRRWPVTLRRLNPQASTRNGVTEIEALLDIDNSEGELYPNMTVQVFFANPLAQNVLTVPVRDLTVKDAPDDVTRATVEIIRPDGRIETREIAVGAQDRVNAEVLSGLSEGDRVIDTARRELTSVR